MYTPFGVKTYILTFKCVEKMYSFWRIIVIKVMLSVNYFWTDYLEFSCKNNSATAGTNFSHFLIKIKTSFASKSVITLAWNPIVFVKNNCTAFFSIPDKNFEYKEPACCKFADMYFWEI